MKVSYCVLDCTILAIHRVFIALPKIVRKRVITTNKCKISVKWIISRPVRVKSGISSGQPRALQNSKYAVRSIRVHKLIIASENTYIFAFSTTDSYGLG